MSPRRKRGNPRRRRIPAAAAPAGSAAAWHRPCSSEAHEQRRKPAGTRVSRKAATERKRPASSGSRCSRRPANPDPCPVPSRGHGTSTCWPLTRGRADSSAIDPEAKEIPRETHAPRPPRSQGPPGRATTRGSSAGRSEKPCGASTGRGPRKARSGRCGMLHRLKNLHGLLVDIRLPGASGYETDRAGAGASPGSESLRDERLRQESAPGRRSASARTVICPSPSSWRP
jgi:hypothetical protein